MLKRFVSIVHTERTPRECAMFPGAVVVAKVFVSPCPPHMAGRRSNAQRTCH